MARSKGSASADAAKKRSIARRFNDILMSRSPQAKALDKRTARRLDRYRRELKRGRKAKNKELSPLDVAMRVNALLEYGDRLSDVKKLAKPRKIEYDEEHMAALIAEMHGVYGFRPEAYRHAGVTNETLVAAGVLETLPRRRGPLPKKAKAAAAKGRKRKK